MVVEACDGMEDRLLTGHELIVRRGAGPLESKGRGCLQPRVCIGGIRMAVVFRCSGHDGTGCIAMWNSG
jgi:hypothetical protein